MTIGVFFGPRGHRYLLLVNKNPCSLAHAMLTVSGAQRIEEVSPEDGSLKLIQQDTSDTVKLDFTAGQERLLMVTAPLMR
jgi:hypothetical protein